MGRWFVKTYDTFMAPLEKRGLADLRASLLAKATGDVLEIGSGTGLNFEWYRSPQVHKVIAVEPSADMINRSGVRVSKAKVPIQLVGGEAENLPYANHSFDTVVGTLVLCTVKNPIRALKEIRRVCKPGGKALFLEHIRLDNRFLAMLQDGLTPMWKRVCDGCHLNRDTLRMIEQAGFKKILVEGHAGNLFVVAEYVNEK